MKKEHEEQRRGVTAPHSHGWAADSHSRAWAENVVVLWMQDIGLPREFTGGHEFFTGVPERVPEDVYEAALLAVMANEYNQARDILCTCEAVIAAARKFVAAGSDVCGDALRGHYSWHAALKRLDASRETLSPCG